MKVAQYEVLGNDAKRNVRPAGTIGTFASSSLTHGLRAQAGNRSSLCGTVRVSFSIPGTSYRATFVMSLRDTHRSPTSPSGTLLSSCCPPAEATDKLSSWAFALSDCPNYGTVTELSHPPDSGSEMQGIKGCRRDAPISLQRKGNSCRILSLRWPNPHFTSTGSLVGSSSTNGFWRKLKIRAIRFWSESSFSVSSARI